jgi:hypothetical protein
MTAETIRSEILRLTREYTRLVHSGSLPGDHEARAVYEDGATIPYAARVFGEEEVDDARA